MEQPPAPTALAGLDRIDWSRLRHAYGPADDVPALLRALADAADPESRSEAGLEAWSSLAHQGTVYAASVAAVPFLAALAVADTGPAAAEENRTIALDLLAEIAKSTDEHELPAPGAARAAVIEQLPLLQAPLDDPARKVRQAALALLLACAPTTGSAPTAIRTALHRRWRHEPDPTVRADLLAVRAAADPAALAELRGLALSPAGPAPVRIAALRATVDHGLPWDAELSSTAAQLLPFGPHVEHTRLIRWALPALATGLHRRGNPADALTLLETVAARPEATTSRPEPSAAQPGTAAADELLSAADDLARCSRSAPARLLPLLLPFLDGGDPERTTRVLDALAQWGEPAPQAVPALLRLADRPDPLGDRALHTLLLLPRSAHPAHTPARLAALLADRLPHRWQSLRTVHQQSVAQPPTLLPFDPALLAAVRSELLSPAPPPPNSGLPEHNLAANRVTELLGLLTAWGPAARPALPELLQLLDERPARVHLSPLTEALAAVADPTRHPEAPAALHALVSAPAAPWYDRVSAATALRALTGDEAPLLALLATAFDTGDARGTGEPGDALEAGDRYRLEYALSLLPALGESARPLLPALSALLAAPGPHPERLFPAAETIRALTGDDAPLLALVTAALARDAETAQRSRRPLRLAADLGPAAAPTTPLLLRLLAHPRNAADAARALSAAHPGSARPGGLARTELADRVLAALAADASTAALEALEVLAAAEPLTAPQLAALHRLAEGDARAVHSGVYQRMVAEDLAVRAAARSLHARLSAA
ncbi:hypothetical protein [Kitasatospora sp. NPDC057198]|uniref:hypothetical protein n=1 Tax=Kitasatospora sp. NPDC057198 TaxID=3346046 RepID=UPI00362FF17B